MVGVYSALLLKGSLEMSKIKTPIASVILLSLPISDDSGRGTAGFEETRSTASIRIAPETEATHVEFLFPSRFRHEHDSWKNASCGLSASPAQVPQ